MKTEFNYKARKNFSLPVFTFVVTILISGWAYYFFTKNNQVWMYIMWVLALLLLIVVIKETIKFFKYKKDFSKNSSFEKIILEDKNFTFLSGFWEIRTLDYAIVQELWFKTVDPNEDTNDCDSVIVYYVDKIFERFEFCKDDFENEEDFIAFHDILSEKCVNITNR